MNLNKVILCGRVTKAPEIKETPSGKKVAIISLATNMFMGKGKEDKTTFHNLVAWSSIAEVVEKYVSVGQEIIIEGNINNRNYEDKQGIKKNISEVIVERLQLGSSPIAKKEKVEEDEIPIIDEDEIDVKDIPF
jgi:single-strand DNA-binding protein